MSKPESFISTTDFGTLKNDDSGTVSVSLPAAILTAGQLYSATSTLTVGTENASSRVRVASSKDGNVYYTGPIFIATRVGQIAGPINVNYDIVAFLSRTSPTVVTATAAVTNPYGEGMAMAFGTETFTFEISTFLSPFV